MYDISLSIAILFFKYFFTINKKNLFFSFQKRYKKSMNTFIYNKLKPEIYLKDPFQIAKKHLLGAYLCTHINGCTTVGKITELEVYMGAKDKAAHTYQNHRSKRVESCYKKGGCAYVFFIYGCHYHFNVVIADENDPKAILIRAVEPIIGLTEMLKRRKNKAVKQLSNGPGKLCEALGITKELDGADLSGDTVWIAQRTDKISLKNIEATPRIGIDYAEEYALKKWRFILK